MKSVNRLFVEILSRNKSFNVLFEKERFAKWKYVFILLNFDDNWTSLDFFDKNLSLNFNSILENLFRIKNYLNSVLKQNHNDQHFAFLSLSYFNDQLNDVFNLKRRKKAKSYFKLTMIKSDNDSFLNLIKESSNFFFDREIRMQAILTLIIKLIAEHSQMHKNLRLLNIATIKISKSFGNHNIGSFNDNDVVRQVLIKWPYHTKGLLNETVNQKLFI